MAVNIRKRAQAERLVADCPASVAVKEVVYVSAGAVAGVYQVDLIDIESTTTYPVLGVIIAKLTSTRCVVQIGGEITGLFSGLNPGKQLFVNTASQLTHTVPTRPAVGVRLVYPMAVALAEDALLLRILSPVKLVA